MKKLVFSLLLAVFALNMTAQKNHEIHLTPKLLDYDNPAFYVKEVKDNRDNKSQIGIVKKGFFNTRRPATFEQDFETTLLNYYQAAVPRGSYQRPITIQINQLKIQEKTDLTTEYAIVTLDADYYFKGRLMFSDKRDRKVNGLDVTTMHAANVRSILAQSIKTFAASGWLEKIDDEKTVAKPERTENETANPKASVENNSATREPLPDVDKPAEEETTRNILAVGYQIGGYTLAGINYEIRVHDYIGVHFGAGIFGLTGGVKIHTNPSRDSNFFNLSVKDGGFGGIETAGVEFGGRWVFKDGARFGLHYQIGIAGVISIAPEMEDQVYDGNAPDASLVMGIGFSW